MRTFFCFITAMLALSQISQASTILSVYAQLRREAISHSPDIQIAQSTLKEKAEAAYTAWTRWMPRVDLQLSETNAQDYSFLTTGVIPPEFANYVPPALTLGGWMLKASLPLYRRAVFLDVTQSSKEKQLASDQLASALSDLDWQLRTHLGDYLLSAYRVATLDHSIAIANDNFKEAQVRFNLGQRTRVDVLRMQANLVSLESKRLTAVQKRTSARNDLAEFTGVDAEALSRLNLDSLLQNEAQMLETISEFTDTTAIQKKLGPYLEDGALALEQLSRNGPAYRVLNSTEALDTDRARNLMAEEWPELVLQGSLQKQSPQWGDLFNGREQSYSIGLFLNVPLFVGGSLLSTSQEQVDAETIARATKERQTWHLRNEVDDERLQIEALVRTVASEQLDVEEQEEIVKLSTKTYELGRSTLVELLGSENDWLEAKVALASSKIDLSVLMHRFAATLGLGTGESS